MLDQIYYYLSDAERILACSRDTINRYVRVGMLVAQGDNHGRRITGASLRALNARIEQGEDLCATLRSLESAANAPSAPKRTAKAQSTKTPKDAGGTSPRPRMDGESLASAPLVSKGPNWLKKIT